MSNAETGAAGWKLEASYARLPERFYARVAPTPVATPTLVRINEAVARRLGLDPTFLRSTEGVHVFAGNRIIEGTEPIAQAYAGHQFGHFVPSLGDGRAILLGEQISPSGERFDIQLKGSGPTPFSRRGDGRAALGPMMREYIIGEALQGLKIPTTRALALVMTGEPVYREGVLPGAIMTRVASSHIRVGTFEYFAARNDSEAIVCLAEYTIARHYPECLSGDQRFHELLVRFIDRQAALVARWLLVGFVHGVMNTDNVALSAESIDFGPCAFIDAYDSNAVFSSIDAQGRYAFGAQPAILQWNLARFAETILPLIHPDSGSAVRLAEEALSDFGARFQNYWLDGLRKKTGLHTKEDGDRELIKDLLERMQEHDLDYCSTFRNLSSAVPAVQSSGDPEVLREWLARWRERISPDRNARAFADTSAEMREHNPALIARNYLVEQAIAAGVERGDFSVMDRLVSALSDPFQERPEYDSLRQPPTDEWRGYRTFCGT